MKSLKKVKESYEKHLSRKDAEEVENYLTDYKSFYGDELKILHTTSFVERRLEKSEQEITENRIFDKIEEFIQSQDNLLVLSGEGGVGKSRILIELARKNERIQFIHCRRFRYNLEFLRETLKSSAEEETLLVFDEYQEYPGFFEQLLDIFYLKKPKIIVSSQFSFPLKDKLEERRFSCKFLHLEKMENVSEFIPSDEIREEIEKISDGNPALAVMAHEHWKRVKTLQEIEDGADLMNAILWDFQAQFEKDIRVPLAEISMLRGIKSDSPKAQAYLETIEKLQKMKHITTEETGERRIYKIVPDRLAEHIAESVYFQKQLVSPDYILLLKSMKNEESLDVLACLNILNARNKKEIYLEACRLLLMEMRAREGVSPDTRLELGLQAYDAFENERLITENLGNFWEEALNMDRVDYLHRTGEFLKKTGKTEQAEKYWKLGLELARKDKSFSEEASLLHTLAVFKENQENHREALELYDESRKLAEKTGNAGETALALFQMGNIQFAEENYSDALTLYKQSREIEDNPEVKQRIIQTLNQMGNIQYQEGNLKNAMELYRESLKLAEELEDKDAVEQSLYQIELVQKKLEEKTEKKEEEEKEEEISQLEEEKESASSVFEEGNIQFQQGNLKQAMELYEKSRILAEKSGEKQIAALAFHQMGLIQQDQKNYREAMSYFSESMDIKKELGDKKGIAQSLSQMGKVFEKENNTRHAVFSLMVALRIFEELDSPDKEETRQDIARIRLQIGEQAFQKIIENFEKKLKE